MISNRNQYWKYNGIKKIDRLAIKGSGQKDLGHCLSMFYCIIIQYKQIESHVRITRMLDLFNTVNSSIRWLFSFLDWSKCQINEFCKQKSTRKPEEAQSLKPFTVVFFLSNWINLEKSICSFTYFII